MKTLSQKQLLFYTFFSLAAGFLLADLRVIISCLVLDHGIELYQHGTPADDILHIAIVLCVGVLCSVLFLPQKEDGVTVRLRASVFTVFSASFCAFMVLAYDFLLIYETAAANWSALNPILGRRPVGDDTTASAVFLLCLMASAIPAVVCFFKIASSGVSEKHSFPFLVSFPVIWQVLLTLHVYFDTTTAMNSPIKVLRILALLSFVVYAIQEARCMLGLTSTRSYFVSACVSVLLGVTVTLSDAILYVVVVIMIPEGYILIAVKASYVIYIMSRLFALAVKRQKKNAPPLA